MKKIEKTVPAKPLKDKLIAAVHKVLIENKSVLTDKIQKVINKSIKKITKKTGKQIEKALNIK